MYSEPSVSMRSYTSMVWWFFHNSGNLSSYFLNLNNGLYQIGWDGTPALVFDRELRRRALMSCQASSQKRGRWDSSCSGSGPTRISIGYVNRAVRLPRRVRASHWLRTCFHGPVAASM